MPKGSGVAVPCFFGIVIWIIRIECRYRNSSFGCKLGKFRGGRCGGTACSGRRSGRCTPSQNKIVDLKALGRRFCCRGTAGGRARCGGGTSSDRARCCRAGRAGGGGRCGGGSWKDLRVSLDDPFR